MEVLQTISPWIRYSNIVLIILVPVLLTFSVYLVNTNLSIPLYCFLFIIFVAANFLVIGFLYRKLINDELAKRIEKQEEKIKKLGG